MRATNQGARIPFLIALLLLVAIAETAPSFAAVGEAGFHGEQTVTLLVHGMALDPAEHTTAWGMHDPAAATPAQRWTSMIGALRRHGLSYGGELRTRNGAGPIGVELSGIGADASPSAASLFSLQFSTAANSDGLAYRALELKECIAFVRAQTDAARVNLVAHSAGGMVARAYLQDALPGVDYQGDVARLITIATPHLGSAMAEVFGGLLGAQASSLRPSADLIRQLDLDLPLPDETLYASLVVRAVAADAHGDFMGSADLVDWGFAVRLPQDYRVGGDQLVQALAQNLAVTPVAQAYEQRTSRPILFPLARVTDPTPDDKSLSETKVHEVVTADASVQALVAALVTGDVGPWQPKQASAPWVQAQARMLVIGAIERTALSEHPLSELSAVRLTRTEISATGDGGLSIDYAGDAETRGNLLKIFRHRTPVAGRIDLHLDAFGRCFVPRP